MADGRKKSQKTFEIIKASRKSNMEFNGLMDDKTGRWMPFGKRTNALRTRDAGLAKDISDTLGNKGTRDVVVIEVDDTMTNRELEEGATHHRWLFSHRGVPWGQYDKLGRRIYGEAREEAGQEEE